MNLSEKSNIDRMTLKVLKGHVDDMLKDMLQTYKKQGNVSVLNGE